ncbi:2Fe-2S iron-sulfur cluster-binding protein [Paraburkholderia sp. 32]|uniref:2Fe-2S iron-sulfur cluster-binding protein n=1 Tax=Paraburkholderia sp. 32 TaxID=2991057 RepID=UPI003D1A8013
MTKAWVETRAGQTIEIESEPGYSLMEAIRNNGVEELLAMCGGSCSCATCHVYIDDAFASRLNPMTAEEKGIVEGSMHFTAQSRLSCQIPFDEALSGIRFVIAPEE